MKIIDKNITYQSRALWRAKDGGNEWRELSEAEGNKPALTDEQVLELSELIIKIENHYGFPCDIEWAWEAGTFYITQSRPITTLSKEDPKSQKKAHVLYWEDVDEPVLYAELDDYSWKLPEKIFGYKKRSSFYIYHDRKLAAFYHPDDISDEARVGLTFFGDTANIERIIDKKQAVAEKVLRYA
ncbi:MAG: PEP/pyruvate-binding domain-containing protein, partial [Patescibacteria group bacterium]